MSAKHETIYVEFYIKFSDLKKYLEGEAVEVTGELVKKMSDVIPTVRIKQSVDKLEITETMIKLK